MTASVGITTFGLWLFEENSEHNKKKSDYNYYVYYIKKASILCISGLGITYFVIEGKNLINIKLITKSKIKKYLTEKQYSTEIEDKKKD